MPSGGRIVTQLLANNENNSINNDGDSDDDDDECVLQCYTSLRPVRLNELEN